MPKLRYFYPRSPCGERLFARELLLRYQDISIHALLAESDGPEEPGGADHAAISIHALLAESDTTPICAGLQDGQFLSTLSLRRATRGPHRQGGRQNISIHALLAESDPGQPQRLADQRISIHALLAESDATIALEFDTTPQFLSTLSLRRATPTVPPPSTCLNNFYPRSPCGERRRLHGHRHRSSTISIHALLAESDMPPGSTPGRTAKISIHALLAESDGACPVFPLSDPAISIHALLAESDPSSSTR